MYGLPQAGILANTLLRERLATHGYHELQHTPGLWTHETRPIWFTLVVDDFGIKYVGKENADHLLAALGDKYTIETDWTGSLYVGITLDWDYQQGHVDLSMPTYVQTQLTKYGHAKPKHPQHCLFSPNPIQYGKKSQDTAPTDDSPKLDKDGHKYIQQVVGSFLFYARAIDSTIFMALSDIAADQSEPTEKTKKRVYQFLNYMATHPNAKIRYRQSDMILNIHSDRPTSLQNKHEAEPVDTSFLVRYPVMTHQSG